MKYGLKHRTLGILEKGSLRKAREFNRMLKRSPWAMQWSTGIYSSEDGITWEWMEE